MMVFLLQWESTGKNSNQNTENNNLDLDYYVKNG